MKKHEKDMFMAKKIAECVCANGGRTFFVGGLVRDRILGKENKDVDIEIHGIPVTKLMSILNTLGEIDERKVGENFGIMALRGYDIDIAMPRSEKPTGAGDHKGFIIDVDPYIGVENAARRRDFTINALMEDVITGEIVDCFGGCEDIEKGIIRHVDSSTYGDDPLRVLRAAQFAARFGFSIADETVQLSKRMDLSKLSKERIAGELSKALLKAEKPSIFFNEMRRMEQMRYWFHEIETLKLDVLDKAVKFRDSASSTKYFMVSALCCEMDAKSASEFVMRIFYDKSMEKYACNMNAMLDEPTFFVNGDKKEFFEMCDRSTNVKDLIMLASLKNDYDVAKAMELVREYDLIMSELYITGDDLIANGYIPDQRFRGMLEFAHACHLAGVPRETALEQLFERFPKKVCCY